MHVLILAQYYPPDLGGSSTRAHNVARGLARNGLKATVVAAFPHYPHGEVPMEYRWKPYRREQVDGVEVIRTFMLPIESKGLLYRAFTFVTFILSSLIGLLLVRDVDVVWAANPDVFALIPGTLYKWVHRCPLIFNVDDLSMEDIDNLGLMGSGTAAFRLAKIISAALYRGADAVTPLSSGYFDGISKFGVPRSKMHLIRSGVDLDVFRQAKRRTGDKYTVAYSGSFSVAYDFDQVIRAADLLRDEGAEFWIQGKGEQGPKIRDAIQERRLSNVKLFDAILTREQVAEFLGKADSLILPLKDFNVPYLGISSKLYEYQALGKPIICCSSGNSAEYVRDTRSGLIVAPGDYEGLAEAVRFLRGNPMECERMGRAGRIYVERHVGVTQIGWEMRQMLEQVIA
jgi:glycosyltransferase involved in cell wall biosynthesis